MFLRYLVTTIYFNTGPVYDRVIIFSHILTFIPLPRYIYILYMYSIY